MIKYTDTRVVFEEIPDEITLAINISNCPHHCPGCHSAYLQQNVGERLDYDEMDKLLKYNNGITCVAFMGDGGDLDRIFALGIHVQIEGAKAAIYTGAEELPQKFWEQFDYIKLGPYVEKLGPLNCPTTNQRLYAKEEGEWKDITSRFWKKGEGSV